MAFDYTLLGIGISIAAIIVSIIVPAIYIPYTTEYTTKISV